MNSVNASTLPDSTSTRTGLPPVIGYRDLILFYVVTVYGLRLIPDAAAFGPGVIVLWVLAFIGYCIPQGGADSRERREAAFRENDHGESREAPIVRDQNGCFGQP